MALGLRGAVAIYNPIAVFNGDFVVGNFSRGKFSIKEIGMVGAEDSGFHFPQFIFSALFLTILDNPYTDKVRARYREYLKPQVDAIACHKHHDVGVKSVGDRIDKSRHVLATFDSSNGLYRLDNDIENVEHDERNNNRCSHRVFLPSFFIFVFLLITYILYHNYRDLSILFSKFFKK
jgi:hypothetical protein